MQIIQGVIKLQIIHKLTEPSTCLETVDRAICLCSAGLAIFPEFPIVSHTVGGGMFISMVIGDITSVPYILHKYITAYCPGLDGLHIAQAKTKPHTSQI